MGRREASLTNEEKLDRIRERKNKRARKTARCRWLKNLLWWLFGTISGIAIIGATVAVAVCVIPVDTYLNLAGVQREEDEKLISDKLANSSLLNIGLNIGAFTVGDLPVVVDALSKVFPEYKEYEKPVDFDPTSSDAPISDLYILYGEEYLPAFNEVGEYINSANVTSPLYLKNNESFNKLVFEELNLDEMPFAQFKTEGLEKLKAVKIARLLKAFGLGNILEEQDEDGETKPSALGNVIGDKTVMQVKEIEPMAIVECLKLSMVLPITENEVLYDVLLDIVNFEKADSDKLSAENLTIGSLMGGGFSLDGVKLSKFLTVSDNATLYDVLSDATGISDKANITVGDLKTIEINDVKLNTVLTKNSSNEKLFNILTDVSGKAEDKITLADLTNFEVDDIKLSTVLTKNASNEKLFNILTDVSGKAEDKITLADLTNFNPNDIKLKTVLPTSSSNLILKKLLEDETATLGTLSAKIDDLDFCEIYGHECFEKYVDLSGKAKYVKVLNKDGTHYDYVLSAIYEINPALYTGTEYVEGSTTEIQYYQVSNTAGVWLFMMYHEVNGGGDSNLTDGKGNAEYYEYCKLKVNDLADGLDVSESISLATVRQFIDAGIVKPTAPITNETLLNMTIEDAILKLNAVMPSE